MCGVSPEGRTQGIYPITLLRQWPTMKPGNQNTQDC
jgi:hypothetical protein